MTETYIATQIDAYLRLLPVVAMVSRRVEYYHISTEDSKASHSISIHVIIELEAR